MDSSLVLTYHQTDQTELMYVDSSIVLAYHQTDQTE